MHKSFVSTSLNIIHCPCTFHLSYPYATITSLINKLWQCCSNNLSTRFVWNRFVASLLNVVTMLFQQLLNKLTPQQACSKLVNKVVTMLFQQLVNEICLQQVCSKLVNKLWQCCSNNLSTRFVCNRFVTSLLTIFDNAVPTTCQQDVFAIGL